MRRIIALLTVTTLSTLHPSFAVADDSSDAKSSDLLPSDYDKTIRPEWAAPQKFDRPAGYDPSWLRYDEVDIYCEPLD